METQIAIFSYIDEDIHAVYAPSLDLFGYGDDEQEAKQSFEIVLTEYLNYQAENNTLEEDLRKNGWNVNDDENIFSPPSLQKMLENESDLARIIQKPYKKNNLAINLPIFA
jgi:hypothetical protein